MFGLYFWTDHGPVLHDRRSVLGLPIRSALSLRMPEPTEGSFRGRAVPYCAAIFLSAFLLFQVQLLVGKYFLPWFGGTPAMWTTCMFFFQTLLLVGYLYSHSVASRLSLSLQGKLHLAVLFGAFAWLGISAVAWHSPLMPSTHWKPNGPESPVWHLVVLLVIYSGFPYLTLSDTGPLLQNWFAKIYPDVSPYRLYSLSNLGSFLALLTYPFIVEPWFTLKIQAWLWSAGCLLFVGFCGYCAWHLREERSPSWTQNVISASENRDEQSSAQSPGITTQLFWVALAACGSLMFFATTSEICQNIAVVPFLWVLPLSIYLMSFVICFDKPQWYSRAFFQPGICGQYFGRDFSAERRRSHEALSADRWLFPDSVRDLHDLPWRTREIKTCTAVLNTVLFDGRWRRLFGGDIRGLDRTTYFQC